MQETQTQLLEQSDEVIDHGPRLDWYKVAPDALRAQFGLERFVHASGLEPRLLHLVKLYASILNGCAYCIDMHSKDARYHGETEQRVYAVSVWRETPFYSPRERAALAWTRAVTVLGSDGVPDEVYAEVRQHFDEKELVALTMAIVAINGWTRLSIAFRTPPGSYEPGSVSRLAAAAAG